MHLTDEELMRYSRQLLLPNFGKEAQSKLKSSTVLIVGLGGLGSIASIYLANAGVGELRLADYDEVELSNLQRQITYNRSHIGQSKVKSAISTLHQYNNLVNTIAIDAKVDEHVLHQHLPQVDIVLDGSDNFPTRMLVNRLCHQYKKPLVSAAVSQVDGQLMVFDYKSDHSACYCCLFDGADDERNCASSGVLSSLVGMFGAMQSTECIKMLSGYGKCQLNQLFSYNALNNQYRTIKIKKDKHCRICGA